jgi:ubiquinol-cytochrome c reductase cytochrome b subunit
MLIIVMIIIHLIMLHDTGSSNPTNTETNNDKIKFNTLLTKKDLTPSIILIITITITAITYPNYLGDVENFNPANPMVAPIHIQPEWYFLFAYVILRSIPSKLGGVIALIISIIILITPIIKKNKSTKFNTTKKIKV